MKSPSSAIMVLLLLTHSTLGESQTCNSSMIKNAPDSRYIMATNGTVFDKKTGLIWMRCALGQTWNTSTCFGTPKTYTWQNALKAAESVSFAGQSDWRLPNQKELQSLVENSCYLPAINLKAFPNATNNTLWSATPRSPRTPHTNYVGCISVSVMHQNLLWCLMGDEFHVSWHGYGG